MRIRVLQSEAFGAKSAAVCDLLENISANKHRWSKYGTIWTWLHLGAGSCNASLSTSLILENFYTKQSIIKKKKCAGKVNGRDGVTHREDALGEIQVLGSAARWGVAPQKMEQPTLHQPWAQRTMVGKWFWLPPQAGLVPVAEWGKAWPAPSQCKAPSDRPSPAQQWGQWGLPSTANRCGGLMNMQIEARAGWLPPPHLPPPHPRPNSDA